MISSSLPGLIVLALTMTFLAALVIQLRRRRKRGIGSGAIGSVYDMLNQDKRNAVEIIVEQKAEAVDPEHADGNLPELEDPK